MQDAPRRDDPGEQPLAGSARRPMPDHPVAQAVRLEGEAPRTGADDLRVFTWLFRERHEPEEFDLDRLSELVREDANLAWIDLSSYAEADLRRLAVVLGLHRIGVHEALSSWKRPRLDAFKDHFFVSVTVARLAPRTRRVHAHEMDLFVGRNFLLSTHKQPLPFIDRVLSRAYQSPDLIRLDSAYLLYIILDDLLAHYEGLHEQVQLEIEGMEERALRDTSDSFLEDMLRFKRYTFALGQLAEQHREVFAAFLRPDFHWVSGEEVDIYYRDLDARLGRLLGLLQAARDSVNGSFDIYVSHVTHRTNQVIKVLTMASTILFSATLVAALFSTNIQGVPLYRPGDYLLMLAIMLIVGASIVCLFRWRRWI